MAIKLNNKTLSNVTIFGLALRYTRLIDRKLYTLEYHCVDANEVLEKLDVLSNSDDDTFKLMCTLSKSINDVE